MANQSSPLRIRLADYLALRAIDVRSDTARSVLSAILRGDQKAVAFPRRPSITATHGPQLYRAINAMAEIKEICVLSQPDYMRELKNAARGLEAKWEILDQVILIGEPNSLPEVITPTATSRLSKPEQHGEIILNEIKAMGYEPLCLPQVQVGRSSIKAELKQRLTKRNGGIPPRLKLSQFKTGWEFLRADKKISDPTQSGPTYNSDRGQGCGLAGLL